MFKDILRPDYKKIIVLVVFFIIMYNIIDPMPKYALCEPCADINNCQPCPIFVNVLFMEFNIAGIINPTAYMMIILLIDLIISYILACYLVTQFEGFKKK